MNDIPLYNTGSIKIFTEYINQQYPGIDIEPILEYAGITSCQLEDAGHWLTQDQVDRFYEIIARKTGNSNIAREAGRYSVSSKAGLPLQQYALGFITPATAYAVMEKLYNRVNLACALTTKRLDKNRIEIIVTPKKTLSKNPISVKTGQEYLRQWPRFSQTSLPRLTILYACTEMGIHVHTLSHGNRPLHSYGNAYVTTRPFSAPYHALVSSSCYRPSTG